MSKLKLTSVFIACLFSAVIYASEPAQPEVTIDSPPEVIAEDFVRVAVVPKPWVYRLWSWLGTDQVDVRNLTDADFEKYIQDAEKRDQAKQIYREFKKLDSFTKGDVINKVKDKLRIRVPNDEVIISHVNKLTDIIKQITSLDIDVLQSDDTHFIKNTLYIYTVGHTRDSDICLTCPETSMFVYETEFFRSSIPYDSLSSLGYVSTNQIKIIPEWDNTVVFTDIPSFSEKKGFMFHVEGKYNFNTNYEIDNAECRIHKEHIDEIKKALTTECLLRSLGLPQLSNNSKSNLGDRRTFFEEISWSQSATLYDLLLLKIIYDERIKPGMGKEELFSTILNVINSINVSSLKEY